MNNPEQKFEEYWLNRYKRPYNFGDIEEKYDAAREAWLEGYRTGLQEATKKETS